VTTPMVLPILLPIIGYSVLSVLVSYAAIRLYRSRGSSSNDLPNHVSSSGKTTSWDWRKSFLWFRPQTKKKAKPSKHISVDLLPITGLPPPPTAVPGTPPPLVDISSASIPRTPSPPASPYQHINKQVHSLHHTSFPRPPSPHALLATTSPTNLPRRSRSLGGVPVRRLSGGASGLRNVQILDMEMQEMNRGTSREHLLIDFSSSGSSDELDALRKENEEVGLTSRRISPASSDIGVLPSHRRPSLFDDAEDVALDLAPGRKVVQLVDLGDVEDGLGLKQKEDDAWKWFAPPLPIPLPKIHFESTPVTMAKPTSKSILEPVPIIALPLPLSLSEGKLIDFHSAPEEEHVLVDLDVQDDNVPQQEQPEFIRVYRTSVDLDLAVSKPTVDVEPLDEHPTVRSPPEGRRSLDSLKPITIADTTTPVEVQNSISSNVVEESPQRGRRVDRHPLEEEVPETVEVGSASTTGTVVDIEDEDQGRQELVNEHENHELYDHHDDHSYAYNIHHDHSPQTLDTIRGEEHQSSSSSPQVATIPVQAAPAWYWDHEDDPWNGAVGVNEEGVKEGERGEEREVVEEREDERGADVMDVPETEAGLEVGEDDDTVKTLPGSKVLELPIEFEVPIEMQDEESYPDPDYLPLPESFLGRSPIAGTEVPLVLVENEQPNNFQENSEDADENQIDRELQQQFKDEEKSPRRVAAQMPTPPASPPPPSPLRVKGLGLGSTRSGPPSPSPTGRLLPLASPSLLSIPLSTSPKLAPLLLLTPPNTSPSVKGDKEHAAGVDKENEMPNSTTGRPLWSIRAGDAPALGLAASSLLISTSTASPAGLIPGVGTSMDASPRMRRVLGDLTVVENGEREEKEVEIKEEKGEEEKDDEDDESLPGAFPGLLKPTSFSDTNTIVAPTITIAALTSTLLSTSIATASSVSSTSTALETTSPVIQRRPRQPIKRSPLDIALAMQLRPGLGVGADPAWMVRFLMAMFGWFAILVSGQGEF